MYCFPLCPESDGHVFVNKDIFLAMRLDMNLSNKRREESKHCFFLASFHIVEETITKIYICLLPLEKKIKKKLNPATLKLNQNQSTVSSLSVPEEQWEK